MNENEENLVSKAQAGDTQAFGQLMREQQDILFAMILRQVGRRDIAEDLTQETFIKAYKGMKRFRGDSSFRTWLIRIALNQTNSYFKSKRYKQSLKNRPSEEHPEMPSNETAEKMMIEKQRLESFRLAIGALAPKYRQVLVLCGLEGNSYETAAEILGIPVGTVRSRLNTARLQARKHLSTQENSL